MAPSPADLSDPQVGATPHPPTPSHSSSHLTCRPGSTLTHTHTHTHTHAHVWAVFGCLRVVEMGFLGHLGSLHQSLRLLGLKHSLFPLLLFKHPHFLPLKAWGKFQPSQELSQGSNPGGPCPAALSISLSVPEAGTSDSAWLPVVVWP